jgi:hypothetical protein
MAALAFLVAFGPDIVSILQPYPKTCIAAGVSIALLVRFIKLVEAIKIALNIRGDSYVTKVEKPLVEDPTDPSGPPAAALVLIVGALLFASVASAQPSTASTPVPLPVASTQNSGCFQNGSICLGPSVTITVGEFNFSTSKFTGGIIPGIGYGATFMANTWHKVGIDLYLSAAFSQSVPNNVTPSLMLSFANYVRIGLGCSFTEQPAGPVLAQPLLLGGIGTTFDLAKPSSL